MTKGLKWYVEVKSKLKIFHFSCRTKINRYLPYKYHTWYDKWGVSQVGFDSMSETMFHLQGGLSLLLEPLSHPDSGHHCQSGTGVHVMSMRVHIQNRRLPFYVFMVSSSEHTNTIQKTCGRYSGRDMEHTSQLPVAFIQTNDRWCGADRGAAEKWDKETTVHEESVWCVDLNTLMCWWTVQRMWVFVVSPADKQMFI